MIRDTRKDEGYFKKYLEYQNKRIDEFREKAEAIRENSKLEKLYLFISGFLRDKLYASYSCGCSTEELKSIYEEWLHACERASSVCYSDLIDLASLCVLLEPIEGAELKKNLLTIIKKFRENDELLVFFQSTLSDGEHKISGEVPRYPVYAELHDVLTSTGTLQAKLLRDYVANIWYAANSDSAWYDSHLSTQDTYVGYWCFVGAALVKIFGLDSNLFQSVEFYPVDLG